MVLRAVNLSESLGKKTSAFLFGARGVGKTRLCLEYLNSLESRGEKVLCYDLLQNDTYERFPGKVRFLLSGSSARKLRRLGSNLLAGRAITLRLHPLLDSEFPQRTADNAQLGSLPGIVIDNERPQDSLRSYVATYLKEEIQQEALVRKVDAFAKFLEVAGQYHGEIINASTIAAYSGVSSQTVAE